MKMPETVVPVPGSPPRLETSTRPPTMLIPRLLFGSRCRATSRGSPQYLERPRLRCGEVDAKLSLPAVEPMLRLADARPSTFAFASSSDFSKGPPEVLGRDCASG